LRTTRPIPTGWLVLVLIHSGLIQAGVYVVRPMATYQAVNLGADATMVGIIGATFALAPFLFAIPVGKWVDFGFAGRATFLGPILTLVSTVGLVFSDQLWQLMLWMPLMGTGHLLAMVGGQTLIAQFSEDKKYETNFGLLTFYASLGHAIGPFVGGYLAESDGPEIIVAPALWFAAGLFVLGAMVTIPLFAKLASTSDGSPKGSIKEVFAVPGYKPAIFVAGATTAVVDVTLIYLPLLGIALGFSVTQIGVLLAIRALFSMAVRFVLGSLRDRFGLRTILVVGSAVTMLGAIGIAVSTEFYLIAALLAVTGFAMGIGQPATMAWVSRISSPSNRGLAISIRLTSNRFGQVVVPVVAGAVAAASVGGVFYLLALLMAMAAGVSKKWAPGPTN
jgi:MFS family permease